MYNETTPKTKVVVEVKIVDSSASNNPPVSEAVKRDNSDLDWDAAYRGTSVTREERERSNFAAQLNANREASEDAGWRD